MTTMMFARMRFLNPGPVGPELLDRPATNFDVIGIPTKAWSSSLVNCEPPKEAIMMAWCCPCVLWSQIVVRSQIPLFISVKNSLRPRFSGFSMFVDYFWITPLVGVGLLLIAALAPMPDPLPLLFYILGGVTLGLFGFTMGHTRTAFKMKYELPTTLPQGWEAWDMLLDMFIGTLCLPCSLHQMARHVFQYDRQDVPLGCFMGDPTLLPPLRPTSEEVDIAAATNGGVFERPKRADEAGLAWVSDAPLHPENKYSGAAIRQEELLNRQRAEFYPTAMAVPVTNQPPTNPYTDSQV